MFRKRTVEARFWEILPGLQFWLVFFGAIFLSYYQPVIAAIFIICFDLYWLIKPVHVSRYIIASYRKFRVFVTIDWLDYSNRLSDVSSFIQFLKNQQLTAAK